MALFPFKEDDFYLYRDQDGVAETATGPGATGTVAATGMETVTATETYTNRVTWKSDGWWWEASFISRVVS